VLKFRTMVVDAEQRLEELEKNNESAGSELFKLRDDPRVTRLGRFLRRSSLDELPQLINVLRGEMSLVGPRPLQLPDSDKLQHVDPEKYYRRLEVKPGITGLWQVASRYELSNWQSMLEVDDHYLTNWSLWLDLRILWKTTLISFLGVEGRNRLPVTPANLANREKNEGVRTPQKESSKPALALRPRNPTRTDQEQRRFEKLIDFGSTIYPLRRPLRGIARLSPDGQRTFTVPDLEPHFIGRGLTLDDACFDWLQAVHIAFQSLFGKLPFEMTGEEYSRWIILSNVIDVDAYEATRPLVLRQIGHVLSAGPGPWIVAWADRTESVALAEMPAEFAALHQGDWFAAIVQRDRTSDHLVAVRQIKPIPPLEPLSNERLSLFWDALPTTASLPVSSSDWTRR